VSVPLPHPRRRADPAFVRIKQDVLNEFADEPVPPAVAAQRPALQVVA
jgi:hypothetical protein